MSDTSLPDLNEATSPTPHDSNDPSQPWPTRGSTEGYVRPSLRLAKKKERKPPLHASLAASIEREHAAAELGKSSPSIRGLTAQVSNCDSFFSVPLFSRNHPKDHWPAGEQGGRCLSIDASSPHIAGAELFTPRFCRRRTITAYNCLTHVHMCRLPLRLCPQ